ncbi:MAG: glycerol-3-phosphate acyltransferase [Dehalococcoidia bacterium]|nr:glycerol-3-phosphate acyltransferase [Dehalococcoidia bacterium]
MNVLLFLALGYLMGSVPFAYLVARLYGVNVFQTGTGNPGAANVFRTISRRAGVMVLVGDTAKGLAPVLLAQLAGVSPWAALAVGVAVMVGHWYPIFLRFRGGAGLATTVGIGYAMMPLPALLATPPALVFLYFRHNTGVAAAVGFVPFFVIAVLMGNSILLALAVAVLPVLALARQRLLPTPGAPVERR